MQEKQHSLIMLIAEQEYEERGRLLAQLLQIPLTGSKEEACLSRAYLQYDRQGLAFTADGMTIRGDFSRMKERIRPHNLQGELLVKAAGIRKLPEKAGACPDRTGGPSVLDATAGLGEDSFLLAAAGFQVTMCERDPVIAALLQDALERGRQQEDLREILLRTELREEDSIRYMEASNAAFDVIYLDPMFPARKKSGSVKKKFQLLHQLEDPCREEEALLQAALRANPGKIIIKRPLKAPVLAGKKPSYSLKGKAIRYDCIVL